MASSTKDHPRKKVVLTKEQRANQDMLRAIEEDYEKGKREIHAGS